MGQYFGSEGKNGGSWTFNFLFDVMAFTTMAEFNDDGAFFTTKWIKSNYYNHSLTALPRYRTFGGVNPPMTPMETMETLTRAVSDNLNVNIIPMGKRLLAISDMTGYNELDPDTLDWIGHFEWSDHHDGIEMITSAHPNNLPWKDDYWYNYHVWVFGNLPNLESYNKYKIWRVDSKDPNPGREIIFEQKQDRVPYVHSFAHTENYLVFFEFNLFWNIMKIGHSTEILPCMDWLPEQNNGTRIRVYDLKQMKMVNEFTTDAFFAYHHINAYEENGEIVVDIGMQDPEHMKQTFNMTTLPFNSEYIPVGGYYRFNIPINGTQDYIPHRQIKVDRWFDLAYPNLNYAGRKYKWFWGLGASVNGGWWDSIVKTNADTGEQIFWYEYDSYPTEPNFIPNPNPKSEDDGILLSMVMCGSCGHTYFLGLDGITLKEVFRASADQIIPFVSHGFWSGYWPDFPQGGSS